MLPKTLRQALRNSLKGLRQTWSHEKAFRLEIIVCMPVLAFLFWYEAPRIDKLFVIFALTLMLMVELINTAIEKANDAFKKTPDPLIQFSKDAASAAVFVSFLLVAIALLNLIYFL